jgi:hypothetical protein
MQLKSIVSIITTIGATLGINLIAVTGLVWSQWTAETTMVFYLLETLLASPLVALRIHWLAPLSEERAKGKVYTRRELLAGYGVFVGGFLLASAIFMAAFFFMILKVSLDFAALGNGLLRLAPFLLISFVTDLVLRRPLTMPQAERLAEGSMGRVALLFLAVFCGIWLAGIEDRWFVWPFVALKTVVDVGGSIQFLAGQVRGSQPGSTVSC